MSSSLFILTPRQLAPAAALGQHQYQQANNICIRRCWRALFMKCGNYKHGQGVGRQDKPKEPVCTRFHLIVLLRAERDRRGSLSMSTPRVGHINGMLAKWQGVQGAQGVYGVHAARIFCAVPLAVCATSSRFRRPLSRVPFLLIFIGVGRNCSMASLLHLAFCLARRKVFCVLPTPWPGRQAARHTARLVCSLVFAFSSHTQHKVA